MKTPKPPTSILEFIDATAAYVASMEGPSFDPLGNVCVYRTATGNRCAIGYWIPDDLYADGWMEGLNADEVMRALEIIAEPDPFDFEEDSCVGDVLLDDVGSDPVAAKAFVEGFACVPVDVIVEVQRIHDGIRGLDSDTLSWLTDWKSPKGRAHRAALFDELRQRYTASTPPS